jgi:hypothetical protein
MIRLFHQSAVKDSSASRSEFIINYLLSHILYLLLQPLILELGLLVLALQLTAVYLSSASQHTLHVVDSIAWFLRLFVELHQNFGKLVNCTSLLKVLLELLLLGLYSALG